MYYYVTPDYDVKMSKQVKKVIHDPNKIFYTIMNSKL